jgi:hypothetical protein
MTVAGSIASLSIRGRNFSVAADSDTTRKIGGFQNELQMNGDGTARVIKTRMGWAVTGASIDVNDARGDHEFLQDIVDGVGADSDGFYPCAIEYASGAVWSGKGTIVDELAYGSNNGTAGISLGGAGELTQQ